MILLRTLLKCYVLPRLPSASVQVNTGVDGVHLAGIFETALC